MSLKVYLPLHQLIDSISSKILDPSTTIEIEVDCIVAVVECLRSMCCSEAVVANLASSIDFADQSMMVKMEQKMDWPVVVEDALAFESKAPTKDFAIEAHCQQTFLV